MEQLIQTPKASILNTHKKKKKKKKLQRLRSDFSKHVHRNER